MSTEPQGASVFHGFSEFTYFLGKPSSFFRNWFILFPVLLFVRRENYDFVFLWLLRSSLFLSCIFSIDKTQIKLTFGLPGFIFKIKKGPIYIKTREPLA
jgi:hypothetical protein